MSEGLRLSVTRGGFDAATEIAGERKKMTAPASRLELLQHGDGYACAQRPAPSAGDNDLEGLHTPAPYCSLGHATVRWRLAIGSTGVRVIRLHVS
jgi:hypothetical protein